MSENVCIFCGEVIPEGRQVCLSCERRRSPPCKDCEDRHVGCHSTCERYEAFRRLLDDYNEKRNAYSETRSNFFGYKSAQMARAWVKQRIKSLGKRGKKGD